MNTPIIIIKSKCAHLPEYVIWKNEIRCPAFCLTCNTPVEVETKEVELLKDLREVGEGLKKPDTLDPDPTCC